MPLSKARQDAIEARRARVAQLRLQRLTERAIAAKLEAEGIINPGTGRPWTCVTVHDDLVALSERWQAEALADTKPIKAELWAELREVRRQAWESGDLTTVLRALKQEAELLGVDAPTKIDLVAYVRELATREGLDPEEAVAMAERIVREGARG